MNWKKAGSVLVLMFFLAGAAWAQEGYLRITSTPDGASISIDGKEKGKTPLLLAIAPGKHTIVASLSAYDSVTQTVEVLENEVTRVDLTLQKKAVRLPVATPLRPSGKGNLTIITDWPDATIYLDGLNTGEKTPATLKDLSAGLHSIILVSGDLAMFDRVFVQPNKTSVVKKSFEDYKKTRLSLLKSEEESLKQKEIEEKRQKLPARVAFKLEKLAAASTGKTGSVLWDTTDTVVLTFAYRKAGATEWTTRELKWEAPEEEPISLEKGTYELQMTATRYKQPKGLLTIIVESKKEKVAEAKASLKKDLQADTLYTFTLSYDGGTNLSYKIEEKALNTAVE